MYRKVIVLGIDGFDPKIMRRMMERGDLGNFARLKDSGYFAPLATCMPPQSPVAWPTIASGSNPGHTGIFDFIDRNPENYLPDLAILKINPRNILGTRGSMFLPVMKGTSFWELTAEAGIPSTIVRWPMTFPPKAGKARILSGLGVPDLKSGLGRYTFYTTRLVAADEEGKDKVVRVYAGNNKIETHIIGPWVAKLAKKEEAQLPLRITIDRDAHRITLEIEKRRYSFKEKEWSDWIELKFSVGFLKSAKGITKFYLNSIEPDFELYMTPIQVDPLDPCFPISQPDSYAQELVQDIGRYYTLGMPEDTKAFTENRISEDVFLQMCNDIVTEQEKMLRFELERFREGLFGFVFFTMDRIQHVLWSTTDPQHPFYNRTLGDAYGHVISDYYRRMDGVLGEILHYVDSNTAIIVCSDHGFTSYRRSLHVNSWLAENGFMALRSSVRDKEGGALFRDVVWERTKAYSLGFGSVYLNLKDREGKGTVQPGEEAERVKGEIVRGLMAIQDPKTGRNVVSSVRQRDDLYRGPYVNDAPDLIAGLNAGYRFSSQTAIGGAPEGIIEDNLNKWSGDHCIDAQHVPGILFANMRIKRENPRTIDIAPTVLKFFGLQKPEEMEGSSLIEQVRGF